MKTFYVLSPYVSLLFFSGCVACGGRERGGAGEREKRGARHRTTISRRKRKILERKGGLLPPLHIRSNRGKASRICGREFPRESQGAKFHTCRKR